LNNMRQALERTYQATPDPKWVVAVGDCAANGGLFAGSYAVAGGVGDVVPVDLHLRGCPPTPLQLLQGLLALLDSPLLRASQPTLGSGRPVTVERSSGTRENAIPQVLAASRYGANPRFAASPPRSPS